MAGLVHEVSDDSFDKEVVKSTKPTLVDFWAPWCGPCRAIAPMVEALASTYEGKLNVAKVNVDDNQGTASRYGIRAIPTLLIFKDGQVVEQIVGAVPREKLEALVQKHA